MILALIAFLLLVGFALGVVTVFVLLSASAREGGAIPPRLRP